MNRLKEVTRPVEIHYEKEAQRLKAEKEKTAILMGLLIELAWPISAIPLEASTSDAPLPQSDIDSLWAMKKKAQVVDEWVALQIGNSWCFLVSTLPDLYTAWHILHQAETIINIWEGDIENYEAWKVELEELLSLRGEMVFESGILGEESFKFVRIQHSRLELTLEVLKQLVGI